MQSNKFAICESLERAQQHTRSYPRSSGWPLQWRPRPTRQFVSEARALTTFPPCSRRVFSALVLLPEDEENVVLSYICGYPVQSKAGKIFLIIELTRELSLSDHWSGYSSEINQILLSLCSFKKNKIDLGQGDGVEPPPLFVGITPMIEIFSESAR